MSSVIRRTFLQFLPAVTAVFLTTNCTQKLSTLSLSSVNIIGSNSTTTSAPSAVPPNPPGTAPTMPNAVCSSPLALVNTSKPTTIVGFGSSASCSEAALAKAVSQGGIIVFNCGGPATISITSTLALRTDIDTTIDGNNLITLDGQGKLRILSYHGPNFQQTKTTVTLQNLKFKNGKSTGAKISPAPSPCSQGYDTSAGGGALWMQDGKLHVINCQFINNQGATPGPDVAGGAIYVLGNLESTVSGSSFINNSSSNGGAIGSLFGNLSIYNSSFISNTATGDGGNSSNQSECPILTAGGYEVGNGGNGGAISIDGSENYTVDICGSTFSHNQAGAGALAGAIFRTPDGARQATNIDRTTFDSNSSLNNAGALYFHNSTLTITNSTFSNNSAAQSAGAIFTDGSALNFTNDTFYHNTAIAGLGGALFGGDAGILENITFVNNSATGGAGFFGAATAMTSTSLVINNSIFSNNLNADCWAPAACQNKADSTSVDFQWPMMVNKCTSVDQACTASTVFKNPQLTGVLADNGGPTMTILLSSTSAAVGAGTRCPATDQRGKTRPATGCALGAVEP